MLFVQTSSPPGSMQAQMPTALCVGLWALEAALLPTSLTVPPQPSPLLPTGLGQLPAAGIAPLPAAGATAPPISLSWATEQPQVGLMADREGCSSLCPPSQGHPAHYSKPALHPEQVLPVQACQGSTGEPRLHGQRPQALATVLAHARMAKVGSWQAKQARVRPQGQAAQPGPGRAVAPRGKSMGPA